MYNCKYTYLQIICWNEKKYTNCIQLLNDP